MAGPELLDRDRELHAVDGLVAEAADGEARLVLIEGAAGIGKTRLLSEARRRAEAAGMRALTARGSELEREFAFGVVRQLFEPVLGRNGERELLLAGAAESAEAVFSAPVGEDAGDTSFAALHGLYWLAVNLTAEAPLALVVDVLKKVNEGELPFDRTVKVSVTENLEKDQILGRMPHNLATLVHLMDCNVRDFATLNPLNGLTHSGESDLELVSRRALELRTQVFHHWLHCKGAQSLDLASLHHEADRKQTQKANIGR